jgi:hypothetical protein
MRRRVAVAVAVAACAGAGALAVAPAVRPDADPPVARTDVTRPSAANPVTNGDGSEVIRQPEGTATQGLPGLETSAKARPVTSLPRTASSRGRVVKGFPTSVVTVAPGSRVRSSGVSSTARTVQVSLVARSPESSRNVLTFFRRQLTGQGFAESVVPAVAGSTASSFRRGADNLVVTVKGDRHATYSLFGTLRVRG